MRTFGAGAVLDGRGHLRFSTGAGRNPPVTLTAVGTGTCRRGFLAGAQKVFDEELLELHEAEALAAKVGVGVEVLVSGFVGAQ